MENEKRHYDVEQVCTHLMRILPIKSVVVAKGETVEEMVVSFMVASDIHNLVDILYFVYSSSNLSCKICYASDGLGTDVFIKVDLSLPF